MHEKGPAVFGNSGKVYVGEWNSEDKRTGFGEQYWKDGSKYEGFWNCDKMNFFGRRVFANGDSYLGEYMDGKASG